MQIVNSYTFNDFYFNISKAKHAGTYIYLIML